MADESLFLFFAEAYHSHDVGEYNRSCCQKMIVPYLHVLIILAWEVWVLDPAIVLGKCAQSVFRQEKSLMQSSSGFFKRGAQVVKEFPHKYISHPYIMFTFPCLKCAVSDRKQDQHKRYCLSLLLIALRCSFTIAALPACFFPSRISYLKVCASSVNCSIF